MKIIKDSNLNEDILSNEKAISVALESARQLKESIGKEWFTANEVKDKFEGGFSLIVDKLIALKLFGFIYERKLEGKESEYKVILNSKQRLELIYSDIEFYNQKIKILKKESILLKKEIKDNKY